MSDVTIYNAKNSQLIALSGLVDSTGTPVSTATIAGFLSRPGAGLPSRPYGVTPGTFTVVLPGSALTFTAVAGTPGSYTAPLSGFDAPAGPAQLEISGSNGGVDFSFSIPATIAVRSV